MKEIVIRLSSSKIFTSNIKPPSIWEAAAGYWELLEGQKLPISERYGEDKC